jgi:hypothetical protein
VSEPTPVYVRVEDAAPSADPDDTLDDIFGSADDDEGDDPFSAMYRRTFDGLVFTVKGEEIQAHMTQVREAAAKKLVELAEGTPSPEAAMMMSMYDLVVRNTRYLLDHLVTEADYILTQADMLNLGLLERFEGLGMQVG